MHQGSVHTVTKQPAPKPRAENGICGSCWPRPWRAGDPSASSQGPGLLPTWRPLSRVCEEQGNSIVSFNPGCTAAWPLCILLCPSVCHKTPAGPRRKQPYLKGKILEKPGLCPFWGNMLYLWITFLVSMCLLSFYGLILSRAPKVSPKAWGL